jgi:hypothetical protein
MQVSIHTSDGASVTIQQMQGDDVMSLIEDWQDGETPTLQFALDDTATTYIARAHIVRIDVD